MTDTEVGLSRTIISGLNFLVCEAGEHPNPQVVRILKIALRDVCLAFEQQSHEQNEDAFDRLMGSDLFFAIQFLSKYASIKDQKLRREVLKEIESLKNVVSHRGH